VARVAVPVIATLLIAAAIAAFIAGGAVEEPGPVISTCNGDAELCDRPPDELVMPATHNSMSAPLEGVLVAAGALDRRPARGRDPRTAVRRALRRQARQQADAHLPRKSGRLPATRSSRTV
jgi:hypothetical protein